MGSNFYPDSPDFESPARASPEFQSCPGNLSGPDRSISTSSLCPPSDPFLLYWRKILLYPRLVAGRTSGSPGICQFPSPSQYSLPSGFINSTSSSVWICPLFSSPPSPLVQAISHPSLHYHVTTSLIYSPHNKWRNAKQAILLFRLSLFKDFLFGPWKSIWGKTPWPTQGLHQPPALCTLGWFRQDWFCTPFQLLCPVQTLPIVGLWCASASAWNFLPHYLRVARLYDCLTLWLGVTPQEVAHIALQNSFSDFVLDCNSPFSPSTS